MRRSFARLFLFVTFVCALSMVAVAQQDYVGRYALYAGYSHLETPDMSLYQRGFNLDAGVNVKRWISLGVDYSRFDGSSSLGYTDLTKTVQAQVAPLLAAYPSYVLHVPFDARTYTITAGPQINFRHFKHVTIFVRPAIGMLHEVVTGRPATGDTIGLMATQGLVGPSLAQADFIRFYGVGCGLTWHVTKHFGLRASGDYVHSYLFRKVLANPRNTARISFGPTFTFGGNVK